MTENKKHKKHANLAKPKLGKFARNEWAFIGAPCDVIKKLVVEISELASDAAACIYMDESHNHDEEVSLLAISTKKGEFQDVAQGIKWDKNDNYILTNHYDFCFVNGNHFKAEKQIVILDPRKKESLGRKLDRLTNVKAFIATDKVSEPYDFLKDGTDETGSIPTISINEAKKIWNLIRSDFDIPPIKALILAGGKSTRMGKDKGMISYHGKPQREYLYNLLEGMVDEVFLSCRNDQVKDLKNFRTIEDKMVGLGPFGAIASAFMSDPNTSWLVIPCDLPLLGKKELQRLINNRNPYRFATAYLNNHTGFPEPLISIWEPKMYQRMLHFLAQGYSCPRKVLINSDIQLIEEKNQIFMMNVNTPEDFDKASIIIEER